MTSRKQNIKIWLDTVNQCNTNFYPYAESFIYNDIPTHVQPKYDGMTISVVNNDTFSCCEDLHGSQVGCLNMASDYHPGGGVESGCFAQEENCFRRSNYFKTLKQEFYPLPKTSCIYTPAITVIKDCNYNLLKTPFQVAMIACAAIRHPELTIDGGYKNNDDKITMKCKISQIFQIGYQYGLDTLVLGAFGCGAFANPPTEVAQMFNETINEYHNCFKRLIFAIKSVKDDNFDVFSHIIHG